LTTACGVIDQDVVPRTLLSNLSYGNQRIVLKDSLITTDWIRSFFYQKENDIIISGHRGGNLKGYPENCLETLIRVRNTIPTFFEIDPRETVDGHIVLMHDETIDRTTTGRGKINEITLEQLRHYKMKDRWGKVTDYAVPMLSEVIEWSKDKVVLNFDDKGVDPVKIIRILDSLDAHNCIFTVHSVSKARRILELSPDMLFSAFIGSVEKFEAYRKANLLSHIVVAYVEASNLKESMKELCGLLEKAGIRYMVSTAPDQDLITDYSKRMKAYQEIIYQDPGIIETDFPNDFIGIAGIRSFSR
jgi:glycerophosphoryl diester phosphodiesterase